MLKIDKKKKKMGKVDDEKIFQIQPTINIFEAFAIYESIYI